MVEFLRTGSPTMSAHADAGAMSLIRCTLCVTAGVWVTMVW